MVQKLNKPGTAMDKESFRTYKLMEALSSEDDLTQRDLSKRLNISVGLLDEKVDPSYIEYFPGFPEGTLIGRASIPGGYAVELAIPATYLDNIQGEKWQAFRLNVGVRDKDPSKGSRVTVKWWRPDRFSAQATPASGAFVRAGGNQ